MWIVRFSLLGSEETQLLYLCDISCRGPTVGIVAVYVGRFHANEVRAFYSAHTGDVIVPDNHAYVCAAFRAANNASAGDSVLGPVDAAPEKDTSPDRS